MTVETLFQWSEALLKVEIINSELRHRIIWDVVYRKKIN